MAQNGTVPFWATPCPLFFRDDSKRNSSLLNGLWDCIFTAVLGVTSRSASGEAYLRCCGRLVFYRHKVRSRRFQRRAIIFVVMSRACLTSQTSLSGIRRSFLQFSKRPNPSPARDVSRYQPHRQAEGAKDSILKSFAPSTRLSTEHPTFFRGVEVYDLPIYWLITSMRSLPWPNSALRTSLASESSFFQPSPATRSAFSLKASPESNFTEGWNPVI